MAKSADPVPSVPRPADTGHFAAALVPQLQVQQGSEKTSATVTLTYAEKSSVFGWESGIPAKDFGEQLRSAVRHLTGQSTLAELEILAEAAPPVRVTPRDIFERRYPEAACHRFRVVSRASLDESLQKVVPKALPLTSSSSQPSQSKAENENLLLPPQRHVPTGAKAFQKAGGNQLQFLHMLEGNKNPKATLQEGTTLTEEEVARHASAGDCWTIFQGRVYDISPYIDYHPGGKRQIMQGAGKDMTNLFHKAHPWVSMEGLVGKLYLGPLVAPKKGSKKAVPTKAPSPYQPVVEVVSL